MLWGFTLMPSDVQASLDTETIIIKLSDNWNEKMLVMADYEELKTFCSSDAERELIFNLLDEIHYHHNQLEKELKTTSYNHSRRVIKRILRHMDKLEQKYHPEEFSTFFSEQCALQTKVEGKADKYSQGFGTHSYSGVVYVQEVQTYRYLKRMTRRIERIKDHVAHFYLRRQIWES